MSYFAYVTLGEDGRPICLLNFTFKALDEDEDLMYLGEFEDYQSMRKYYHSRTIIDETGTLQWLPEDTVNTGYGFTVRKIPI
tara:strand:- start:871 stop:1116 length:246 start_codon:yes stop_codon:yes gene_type:complete